MGELDSRCGEARASPKLGRIKPGGARRRQDGIGGNGGDGKRAVRSGWARARKASQTRAPEGWGGLGRAGEGGHALP